MFKNYIGVWFHFVLPPNDGIETDVPFVNFRQRDQEEKKTEGRSCVVRPAKLYIEI